MVIQEKMVNQALVVYLVLKEKMVFLDLKDPRVQEASQEWRDQRVILDPQDSQEMLDVLVPRVQKDWMDYQVSMEILVLLVLQEKMDLLVR